MDVEKNTSCPIERFSLIERFYKTQKACKIPNEIILPLTSKLTLDTKIIHKHEGNWKQLMKLQCNKAGTLLAALKRKEACVFNVDTGEKIFSCTTDSNFNSISFNNKATQIAVTSDSSTGYTGICVFDIQSKEKIAEYHYHSSMKSCSFDPSDKFLAVAASGGLHCGGDILIYDLTKKKYSLIRIINKIFSDDIRSINYNEDGTHLVVVDSTGSGLTYYDLDLQDLSYTSPPFVTSHKKFTIPYGTGYRVFSNPTNTALAIPDDGNKIRLVYPQDQTTTYISDVMSEIKSIAFNQDSSLIAANNAKELQIFDKQGKEILNLPHSIQANPEPYLLPFYPTCFNPTKNQLLFLDPNKVLITLDTYKHYTIKNYTVDQSILRFFLYWLFLVVKKPKMETFSIDNVLKHLANVFSLNETEVESVWNTLPQDIQAVIWDNLQKNY